ncbi:olfactory receptor 1078-like [Centropristis striata]|uniref:olfactory receptor 1078-like n=1 Tax=Centropristis striata TaxID=184440 RepID=UPI0027E13D6E|nr:olfactory receptor 1078-like [Centropristis striata]
MDDDLNVTYITLTGYVAMGKYRFLYFFIMFTVYSLAMCFSVTIVYLICIHRKFHEPMYIFIAALLMNSIVYNTAMYPNMLINILAKNHIISNSACLLQLYVFYSLSAADFFLLSAMAYDRYVSICKPLQYTTIMRKNTVTFILFLAWLVPLCEFAVIVIMSANQKLCHLTLNTIFCNNLVYALHCVIPRARVMFGMFAMVTMSVFPLLFIYFTYIRILTISYRSSREVRTKASQTCLPHLIVLSLFSCLCAYDVIVSRLGSDIHFIMTFQAFLYYPLFYPIIYGLKMKEISKHLKRWLCQAKVMY